YTLPEDQNNYMYVKNYEINFSTTAPERYMGQEHSQILKDGKLIQDENNFNRYNYSSPLKKVLFKKIEGSDTQKIKSILSQKEKILNEFPNIESDDLEISLSLVIALDVSEDKVVT